MGASPMLGVLYHWIGGLAAASFYIPYRRVRHWSWETYWLVGGVFSWIVAPWLLALVLVPDTWAVIRAAPPSTLLWAYLFGALWGFGGLTFGLTMRYLGLALGTAVALGITMVLGTLMPPLFSGQLGAVARTTSGQVVLLGVAICLVGIVVNGLAGMAKESDPSSAHERTTVPEFNLRRGLLVAGFSGVMSACFAYGLAAGKPLGELTRAQLVASGRSELWQNLPVLIVVLAGGFTTNFVWCVILNVRNRTAHQYLGLRRTAIAEVSATEGVIPWDAEEIAGRATPDAAKGAAASHGMATATRSGGPASLLPNYAFSALAGVVWYLQFFFYSMGETQMGRFGFSSWTLHMASIIIFGSMWGFALKEWAGASRRTLLLLRVGLSILVLTTVVIGAGNYLSARA